MTFTRISCAVVGAVAMAFAAASAGAAEKYKVIDGAISQSLTGKAGDPGNGRKVMVDRRKGNCLACHAIAAFKDQDFHGNIGPALDGVGAVYTPAELRLRLVDPKVLNPDTMMPSFYRSTGFHRVQKKWQGKTIISAQEVEDVIAFLTTLKSKAQ